MFRSAFFGSLFITAALAGAVHAHGNPINQHLADFGQVQIVDSEQMIELLAAALKADPELSVIIISPKDSGVERASEVKAKLTNDFGVGEEFAEGSSREGKRVVILSSETAKMVGLIPMASGGDALVIVRN